MGNTLNHLRKRPSRRTTVSFPYDPSDADRYAELKAAADQADRIAKLIRDGAEGKPGEDAQITVASTAATEARRALDEFMSGVETITFHLVSCGPKKAAKVMDAHPATPEQVAAYEAKCKARGEKPGWLAYDVDAYPVAMIAECTTSIEIRGADGTVDAQEGPFTVEEMAAVFDGPAWSEDDVTALSERAVNLSNASTMMARDDVERLGKG